MGDLAVDTTVEGSNGHYRATISPDWDFWTPNGGYLCSLALRAAAAESSQPRPAAFYCHYLNPPKTRDAILEVETLRLGRRTQSMRVSMSEEGRQLLEALVWTVADGLGGVEHDLAKMPEVPPPSELRTSEEIHAPDKAPFPFWENLESRPITWQGRWDERPIQHPLWRCWYRYRPTPTFNDYFVDAARSIILIDTMFYAAAALAHPGQFPFIAPSMDLAVRFHQHDLETEWLMSSTESPIAASGLMGGYAAVWSTKGKLLATGGQQMIATPLPG